MIPFFISEGKLVFPSCWKNSRLSQTRFCLLFLKVYFIFSYFICFSPFLIRYNLGTNSYEIYKSKYHQITCAVIHFFTLFQYLSYFRNIRFESLHLNPDNYFEFAGVIGSLFYLITIFSTLWRKQREILNIFQLVGGNLSVYVEEPKSRNKKAWRTIIPAFICCVFFGLSIFSVLKGNVATNKWRFLDIPRSYYSRADFVYLFQPNSAIPPKFPSLTQKLCTAWYVFIELHMWISINFAELLFLMSAIFLRLLAGDLCKCLKDRNTSHQGLHYYFSFRTIVQNLNLAIGPLVLCIVLTGLPYHAANIELVFSQEELARRLRVLLCWLIFVATLIIAASANFKLEEMKEWLLRDGHVSGISQATLTIVTQELSHTGLRGWGFFTISYGFLGTILSVLLTYAILIVQLHSSGNNGNQSQLETRP